MVISVVDDNDFQRKALCSQILSWFHDQKQVVEIHDFKNGTDFRSVNFHPELAFFDIELMEENGLGGQVLIPTNYQKRKYSKLMQNWQKSIALVFT